jgi:hypothetical protein
MPLALQYKLKCGFETMYFGYNQIIQVQDNKRKVSLDELVITAALSGGKRCNS